MPSAVSETWNNQIVPCYNAVPHRLAVLRSLSGYARIGVYFSREDYPLFEAQHPPVVCTRVRVRYAETDAMGVAHHTSYIVWLEEGRTELLRSFGVPYRLIEESGLFVVLSDLRVRYFHPATYDDNVLLMTSLQRLRSRQLIFAYTLLRADTDTVLLTAWTEHIVVDRTTFRPTRLPTSLADLIRARINEENTSR